MTLSFFFLKLTDQESVKRCIDECEARIEMGTKSNALVTSPSTFMFQYVIMSHKDVLLLTGLHYRNPFPRAVSTNMFCIHKDHIAVS